MQSCTNNCIQIMNVSMSIMSYLQVKLEWCEEDGRWGTTCFRYLWEAGDPHGIWRSWDGINSREHLNIFQSIFLVRSGLRVPAFLAACWSIHQLEHCGFFPKWFCPRAIAVCLLSPLILTGYKKGLIPIGTIFVMSFLQTICLMHVKATSFRRQ